MFDTPQLAAGYSCAPSMGAILETRSRKSFALSPLGHVLAWRKSIEERELSGATIRRKMAALSSLFEYLSEKNAVAGSGQRQMERMHVVQFAVRELNEAEDIAAQIEQRVRLHRSLR